MKYTDASAILRLLFAEPGARVDVRPGEIVTSSRVVEVETFRAVDRERLLGRLDDEETAQMRAQLTLLLARIDLVAVGEEVVRLARAPFAVNVRAIDAIHVATAELLAREAPDDPLQFWTHDDRQALAALSRGLDVHGVRPRAGPY